MYDYSNQSGKVFQRFLELIKDEWGVTYSLSGIYYLMKDIGMSWVSTRSRHPKQDEQAQTDFKKTLPN